MRRPANTSVSRPAAKSVSSDRDSGEFLEVPKVPARHKVEFEEDEPKRRSENEAGESPAPRGEYLQVLPQETQGAANARPGSYMDMGGSKRAGADGPQMGNDNPAFDY